MSEQDELTPFVKSLNDELDGLKAKLHPLFSAGSLINYSKDMKALERAKTYVMMLYALNSSIFATMKVAGIDVSENSIMNDIKRVQEYMSKIKTAEELAAGRTLQLDREAAGRFIKNALAGNDQYDNARSERKDAQSQLSKGVNSDNESTSTGSKQTTKVKQPQTDGAEDSKGDVIMLDSKNGSKASPGRVTKKQKKVTRKTRNNKNKA
ncbi:hypothetical protein V1511DRAFT_495828 [Dipodascopsis uninucleata]